MFTCKIKLQSDTHYELIETQTFLRFLFFGSDVFPVELTDFLFVSFFFFYSTQTATGAKQCLSTGHRKQQDFQ